MAFAFLLIIICAIALFFMGIMPAWIGAALTFAGLSGLLALGFIDQRRSGLLRRRGRQLQARWGLYVYHYAGLPLPFSTEGNLFLTNNQMLLETEHGQLAIPLTTIEKILLLDSCQIPKLSGRQLADLLGLSNELSFTGIQYKIDQHDPAGRNHTLIMMVFDSPARGANLLILAAARRLPSVTRLFANPILPIDRIRLLGPDSKTEMPVL